jgi:hypothetical protein
MSQPRKPWPLRHILLWWLLANLACWYYEDSLIPSFWPAPPTLANHFLVPDLFQDWASARNRLDGRPIYTPHAVTVPLYFGYQRDPRDLGFIEYNAHPPASVLTLLPLAPLDFRPAFLLWNTLSLAGLAWSLWRVARNLDMPIAIWTVFPVVTLLVVCSPFRLQMYYGQFNLLLLWLFIAAWDAARRSKDRRAGILLGIATVLKLFPGWLLVCFALRSRWRIVAWGALSFAVMIALSEVCLGFGVHGQYFGDVLPVTSRYRQHWLNLSAAGLWYKLFDPARPSYEIIAYPLLDSPLLAVIASAITTAVILGLLAYLFTRPRYQSDEDGSFALGLVTMLIVSPITWDHYFLLLLLPLALVWQRLPPLEFWRWTFAGVLLVLWLKPKLVMEHFLILLDAQFQDGAWQATPLDSLVALSMPLWAMVVLVGLLLSNRGNEPPRLASTGSA